MSHADALSINKRLDATRLPSYSWQIISSLNCMRELLFIEGRPTRIGEGLLELGKGHVFSKFLNPCLEGHVFPFIY